MQRIDRYNGAAANQGRRACDGFPTEPLVLCRLFRDNGVNTVRSSGAAQAEHFTRAFWCLSAWQIT